MWKNFKTDIRSIFFERANSRSFQFLSKLINHLFIVSYENVDFKKCVLTAQFFLQFHEIE